MPTTKTAAPKLTADKPSREELEIAWNFIVKPTMDDWGRGWARLSDDQKRVEIEAAMWRNTMSAVMRPDAQPVDPAAMRRMWAAVRAKAGIE